MQTAKKQVIPNSTWVAVRRRCTSTLAIAGVFLFVVSVSAVLGAFSYTRGSVQAAASSTLNFQARLLTNTGSTVADGSYNIEFNLYTVPVAGTSQWTETRLVSGAQGVTVKNGYLSVSLGDVTAFPGSIAWDQEQYLGMTVRGSSSCVFGACTPTDAEMTPRFKLTAVPYAFRAGAVTNAAGTAAFTADDLVQTGPATPQVINLALAAIRLNQTGAGGLLQLQGAGSDVFTVANNGDTTTTGSLAVQGASATIGGVSQAGGLVLSDGSGNTTSIQAGSTASNLTFTLPTDYGVSGDCLTTNGSGVLSFSTVCGGTLSVNPTANVRKSADETQNNGVNPTATLQNDDQLVFAIGANETWSYRFVLNANAAAAPDIKFAITAPAGATCRSGVQDAEGAVTIGNLACGTSSGLITGNTAEDIYEVTGTVVNGATPGNIQLQWAQNTANAANVIVRQGSYVTANRITGPLQTAQAFIQSGNSFGALAVLGTNDNNDLSVTTNGVERLRVLATGETRFADDIIANGSATGTTGTSAGVGGTNQTTITLAAAGGFANNDVIYIDNSGGSGQDYYTRIVSGGGTTTLTVSPAVGYGTAAGYVGNATVTKYNVQNIGATTTDYTSQANRFFQGYFTGGIIVGAGSTTLSDGILSRTTGDITIEPGSGGVLQVIGTLNATTLIGDGSSITNINGANIAGGTITDASLTSNVALLNNIQTFTGDKTFSGQLISTGGLTVSGAAANINTSGTATTAIGNSAGALTITGSSGSVFVIGGTTIDATELTLLNNKDAALVDINDGVATAITGTGVLTAGSIGGSFGNINIGANIFTGDGSGITGLSAGSISSGTIANTYLTNSGALTVTAGNGLSGGGSVALGGTTSLSVVFGSAANTSVEGDTTITCTAGSGNLAGGGDIITLGTGGTCSGITTNNAVSFTTSVTTPVLTSTAGLTLSSGGAGALTLDSASNTIIIATSDTTLQRTAAGATTIDLADAGATTLSLTNSAAGAASLNLVDGSLQTAGTSRLTNTGVLQNITGLTIASGGASVTGTSSFADATSLNGNVTIGDAGTDRVTINSQILGANALVFQGATDNGFATTFAITDPTANNTITVPNQSGTITLIGSASAQVDTSTNSSLFINKTGATGAILTLQDNGVGVFTIGNDGATVIQTTSTTALNIKNTGGTDYFIVDTTNALVRVGSATADATATVLINDAKNTTGDPTGAAATNGAQYYNSFWQQYRCYRDGKWETCGISPVDRAFSVQEEFMTGYTGGACSTTLSLVGSNNWTCFTSGTANTAYNIGAIVPTADRPGIIRMTTAAGNGNGFTMALAGNNTGSVVIAPQNRVKAAVGQGATITNNRLRVGLHAQTTSNVRPTTGVWWEADATTNANWNYCFGTGAVATCASSGIAITASTLYSLDILVTATGAGVSSAVFTINGTAFTVTNVTIGTATRVNPAISCFNSTNAARECYADYYQFSGVAAARR